MKIDEKRKVKMVIVIAKIARSRRMLHSSPLGTKTKCKREKETIKFNYAESNR